MISFDSDLHITASGHLMQARLSPTPHHDARPAMTCIDTIIIHSISLPPGVFGSDAIEHFFCGRFDKLQHPALIELHEVRVSAHLLIKRTGEMVQFVPFEARAWHAGPSSFLGRTHCNDYSIGIELEGTDALPYEIIQYTNLSRVIRALMKTYPAITKDRIVGHSEVAPDRKTDPGPFFDWDYLRRVLV